MVVEGVKLDKGRIGTKEKRGKEETGTRGAKLAQGMKEKKRMKGLDTRVFHENMFFFHEETSTTRSASI